MDSEELDSQRRQERLRRRRQRKSEARARETAEQREARLTRRKERYRAERRQESQHTRQAQTIEQPNALGGKHAETPEARQERLQLRCSHCHKHIYVQVSACTQEVLTVPPTMCYRKRSTNNVSCSLLRLALQCPHSLVKMRVNRVIKSYDQL